jgi:hypothetical protein
MDRKIGSRIEGKQAIEGVQCLGDAAPPTPKPPMPHRNLLLRSNTNAAQVDRYGACKIEAKLRPAL